MCTRKITKKTDAAAIQLVAEIENTTNLKVFSLKSGECATNT